MAANLRPVQRLPRPSRDLVNHHFLRQNVEIIHFTRDLLISVDRPLDMV